MKVSIIVPVYNASKYLRDCLYSLMRQTLEEIEVIAVDDNSIDNSLTILKEYETKYPNRLKVIHNDENKGQSITRNIGIQLAKGEYIGFVDSDDYVNYRMYQNMYEGAVQNDYPEIVITGICFVKDNYYLENDFSFIQSEKGTVFNVLENPNFVLLQSPSACNKLFRKDIVQNELFLEGKMWEDVAFSFAKMFNANRILYYHTTDYFYRRQSINSVSAKGYDINSHLLDIFDIADQIEKETRTHNRFELLKKQIQFIQIITCLQRAVEVMEWPISKIDKDHICQMMSDIVIEKYGDFRKLPIEELSSKIGFLQAEKLIQLTTDEKKIELSDLENKLNIELTCLQKR